MVRQVGDEGTRCQAGMGGTVDADVNVESGITRVAIRVADGDRLNDRHPCMIKDLDDFYERCLVRARRGSGSAPLESVLSISESIDIKIIGAMSSTRTVHEHMVT